MKTEKIRVIHAWLLILSCITFVVGLVLTKTATDKRNHDVEDIAIRIANIETQIDEGYYSTDYYVYMAFEIDNNTKATLEYLNVVFYFTDNNGKSIGKITSTFGNEMKSIEKGEKGITTSYISESGEKWDSLFYELYYNGLENCNVSYEITNAGWSDDYQWYGN